MKNPLIEKQVIEQLQELEEEQQLQILDFAKFLANKKVTGISGKNLLCFAGSIAEEDLELMSQAIEKECEKIDINEW